MVLLAGFTLDWVAVGLDHPSRNVAADIAVDFTAARGEAEQDGALQIRRFDELREAVGIDVHLVTVCLPPFAEQDAARIDKQRRERH